MPSTSEMWKISIIAGATILIACYAGAFFWTASYDNRLAPRTRVGSIEVGGDSPEEAKQKINTKIDEILLDGLQLSVDGQLGTVPLVPLAAETGDYIIFDVNGAVEVAFADRHATVPALRPLVFIFTIVHGVEIELPVTISKESLRAAVLNTFPNSIQEPVNAGFSFEQKDEVWTVGITPSAKGFTIPTDELFNQLQTLLTNLDPQPIVLSSVYENPIITEEIVEKILPQATTAINAAPYTFVLGEQVWPVEAADLAAALKPNIDENGASIIEITSEGLKTFFDQIAVVVEKPAVDARLIMDNGRVTDFQSSSDGLILDREATIEKFTRVIETADENKTIELVTTVVEPTVKMESSNDLGIKEALGTGTSNYKGSPTNRVKNIRNGVRLLNGLLIKPDEEFSLLSALAPFTTDNGYLPELVIKGDKIEPEVGGGLCQIGTTTFRATMNSGLPITARSNHSLVVRYYNDPSNNNPGTDATIYDPAPDFKFINNTGNYIMFQAEMDEANYTLRFTFWGASDGRRGSYVPPTLVRWIPVGDEQKIETTNLEPGKEKCQEAHIGADATFIYTIENPDNTKTETTFDSHYRPLPRICLVGVEEPTTETETTAETEPIPEADQLPIPNP